MNNLKRFMNVSAMIPWPLFVSGMKNDTMTVILICFQLFCFFTWIYLDNKTSKTDS